jgi:hypothetical protein
MKNNDELTEEDVEKIVEERIDGKENSKLLNSKRLKIGVAVTLLAGLIIVPAAGNIRINHPQAMKFISSGINMSGNQITNVPEPQNPMDAANKRYVDSNSQGGGNVSSEVSFSETSGGNTKSLGSSFDYCALSKKNRYDTCEIIQDGETWKLESGPDSECGAVCLNISNGSVEIGSETVRIEQNYFDSGSDEIFDGFAWTKLSDTRGYRDNRVELNFNNEYVQEGLSIDIAVDDNGLGGASESIVVFTDNTDNVLIKLSVGKDLDSDGILEDLGEYENITNSEGNVVGVRFRMTWKEYDNQWYGNDCASVNCHQFVTFGDLEPTSGTKDEADIDVIAEVSGEIAN